MNITKEFIPYEQSVLLKELGFDEPCFGYYGVENEFVLDTMRNTSPNYSRRGFTSAPLYQQAFRWFREKYNVHMYPTKYDETKWWVNWATWTSKVFDTYEEAELDCLKKLIEIAQTH
jgi:hypothetical protein